MTEDAFAFRHADKGISRFPPNVEQIKIERESLVTWLIIRRHETTLKFPLSDVDCEHLATLLRPCVV